MQDRQSVCGVICEYNPFHKGHAYQLTQARAMTGAQIIVCVMSGPFTQRGDAALFSPALRARMALLAGADVVVELPAAYAIREAEAFALGGVSILQALGADYLSFGCESENIAGLQAAARLLESPTEDFNHLLRAGLKRGCSHARAQGEALASILSSEDAGLVASPNNVLAICYLRAMEQLRSSMRPVPVLRQGDYHDSGWQEGFASATAARAALLRGDWGHVREMFPQEVLPLALEAMEAGRYHAPHSLDLLLRHTLASLQEASLTAYPGVGEGLEHRIMRFSPSCITRKELISKLKTKRYTYTRLNRLLTHVVLELTLACLTSCHPSAFRLLGFREKTRPFLASLPKGILYTKAARQEKDSSFLLDMKAYDLWAMGAGLPLGEGYRQQVVKMP